MRKRREKLTVPLSSGLESSLANLVGEIHQATLITSEPEVPVGAILPTTSPRYAGLATSLPTVQDFSHSLDDLETELIDQESSEDCRPLVLTAILKDLSKSEDGGFSLTFEVGDNDRDMVAQLISLPQRIVQLVVVVGVATNQEKVAHGET